MGSEQASRRVAVTLTLCLPDRVFERHLPCLPEVIGERLAAEIHQYARRSGLGYYPALEYFRDQEGVDPDLLQAVDNISWFMDGVVIEELRRRLRGAFTSVEVASTRTVAFGLPPVRPGTPDPLSRLARHYSPNRQMVSLVLGRHVPAGEDLDEANVRGLLERWLDDSFDGMEITSVSPI